MKKLNARKGFRRIVLTLLVLVVTAWLILVHFVLYPDVKMPVLVIGGLPILWLIYRLIVYVKNGFTDWT